MTHHDVVCGGKSETRTTRTRVHMYAARNKSDRKLTYSRGLGFCGIFDFGRFWKMIYRVYGACQRKFMFVSGRYYMALNGTGQNTFIAQSFPVKRSLGTGRIVSACCTEVPIASQAQSVVCTCGHPWTTAAIERHRRISEIDTMQNFVLQSLAFNCLHTRFPTLN
jgi:hypothetical protein